MIDLNYRLMGQRLRAIRKKQGLTQEQVAEKAEISPQHYSGVETGGVKISLPALIRVANALNASMDELLMDSISNIIQPVLWAVTALISIRNVESYRRCSSMLPWTVGLVCIFMTAILSARQMSTGIPHGAAQIFMLQSPTLRRLLLYKHQCKQSYHGVSQTGGSTCLWRYCRDDACTFCGEGISRLLPYCVQS